MCIKKKYKKFPFYINSARIHFSIYFTSRIFPIAEFCKREVSKQRCHDSLIHTESADFPPSRCCSPSRDEPTSFDSFSINERREGNGAAGTQRIRRRVCCIASYAAARFSRRERRSRERDGVARRGYNPRTNQRYVVYLATMCTSIRLWSASDLFPPPPPLCCPSSSFTANPPGL